MTEISLPGRTPAARVRSTASAAAAFPQALHLFSVGKIEQAHELDAIARRTDPLNQFVRAFQLLGFALLGDAERADQEYERGKAPFGDPVAR